MSTIPEPGYGNAMEVTAWKAGYVAAVAVLMPKGWKLLKDTTQDERSWPEDESHENGNYCNTCVHCLRMFIGHKRRGICKVCALPSDGREASESKASDE